ncbi:MAG: DUF1292 domain-containing protein [bacterium]|nr:DUF1292 domain-containing protein [bacterium]
MTKKDRDLVETVDENGNTVNFELFDIVEIEDKEYALLLPEDRSDDEEADVVVMRLITEGEDYVFEAIEDDEEFKKVSEFIDNMED